MLVFKLGVLFKLSCEFEFQKYVVAFGQISACETVDFELVKDEFSRYAYVCNNRIFVDNRTPCVEKLINLANTKTIVVPTYVNKLFSRIFSDNHSGLPR